MKKIQSRRSSYCNSCYSSCDSSICCSYNASSAWAGIQNQSGLNSSS